MPKRKKYWRMLVRRTPAHAVSLTTSRSDDTRQVRILSIREHTGERPDNVDALIGKFFENRYAAMQAVLTLLKGQTVVWTRSLPKETDRGK